MNVFDKIIKIKKKYPDMRFGQIIQQSIDENKRKSNVFLNDISDKQFLIALDEYVKKHEAKRNGNKK